MRHRTLAPATLIAFAALASFSAAAHAQVVADSVAGFSGTQGANGWSYGFWMVAGDPNGLYDQADMQLFAPSYWNGSAWAAASPPPWTACFVNLNRPNGSNSTGGEQWAVRRWTSTTSGIVRLTGNIGKANIASGDGTRNFIVHNDRTILRQDLRFNDGAGGDFAFLLSIQPGDRIDMLTDPRANDMADGTRFMLAAHRFEPPFADSTINFSGVQGQGGWRYGWYTPVGDPSPGYQPSDFIELPPFAFNGARWNQAGAGNVPSTLIDYTHVSPSEPPAASGEYWAIRRWTSAIPGRVSARLIGRLSKVTPDCGDGSTGAIYHNGAQVWSHALSAGDIAGVPYEVDVDFFPGDTLDFVVKSGPDSACDLTRFTNTVARCPADWNRDNIVDSNDFFRFVLDLLQNGDADFNRDGVTNTADFFDFINEFFSFC